MRLFSVSWSERLKRLRLFESPDEMSSVEAWDREDNYDRQCWKNDVQNVVVYSEWSMRLATPS